MYKQSKWAEEILALQDRNGLWGYFHSLAEPGRYPITTEQALRRLYILGYGIEDAPIKKAVDYMNDCLTGAKQMPDKKEKIHDWDLFTQLMLATWIRVFTKDNPHANAVAEQWARVITAAFEEGSYNDKAHADAYEEVFGIPAKGPRFEDFVTFYQVSIIADKLDEGTEDKVFDYILHHKNGLYYIYNRPAGNASLAQLPDSFESKKASQYLGAIEILADYKRSLHKLQFVLDWLEENKNENGKWDMGAEVNDKVYFPLSDSWWRKNNREADCTDRIERLIQRLEGNTKA